MQKAAIYARFSSENQRDESIDAQICAIEEYARKNNIVIVKTYIDRAKSATTAERPSFQEMIKASETGMFDTIIVHKLDRFARSKYDSAIYKQKLKVNNVRLVSVTENLDGTPESIILESVLEAMAEYYSKNLAREIMKGNMENAKKSVHCGGIPPLGFDIIDKKLVVNEHEAEAVKIIFEMYADGEGYTSIINTLNAKGYKTKVGRPFGKNSLFEILRNEKYRGVYTYNKSSRKTAKGTYNRHAYKDDSEIIRIEDGCPRIVSDELFNRARKRQCENQRESSTNRSRQKYLLSGLVFCGKCGSPMHANRRRKESQLTFRCNRKSQTIQCDAKEINMAYLEKYVLDELQKNIFSFSNVNAIMRLIDNYTEQMSKKTSVDTDELSSQLEEIKTAQQNILNAIEQGMYKGHFAERLAELKQQEESIKAELLIVNQPRAFSVSKKEVMLLINNFHKMRLNADFDGLRKIILNFVEHIDVTDDEINVVLKISFGDVQIDSKHLTKQREKVCEADIPLTKTMIPDISSTRVQAITFLWRAAGSPMPKSSEISFEDVETDSYYYYAVLWALENGITGGTSATTFSPDDTCTRGQIVTFLWRSEKSPTVGMDNPFTDVSSDSYYADATNWAVANGITNGTSDTTFSPDETCTRGQIVTFLYRFFVK